MRNHVLLGGLHKISVIISLCILPVSAFVSVSPADPSVNIGGRTDATNPDAIRFNWNGVYFDVSFTGTSCSVLLHEQADSSAYNVFVDGVFTKYFIAKPSIDTYSLATGLSATKHVVTVARRTESETRITM